VQRYRHNVDTLAREFRVIALDLIGFGRNRLFLRRSKLPLKFDEITALLIANLFVPRGAMSFAQLARDVFRAGPTASLTRGCR
jgi:pimeloyl-ACP methyl ester carboxylesterase